MPPKSLFEYPIVGGAARQKPQAAPVIWRAGLIAGVALGLALLAGAAGVVLHSYHTEMQRARQTAANLSTTLAAHADQVFVAGEKLLASVVRRMPTDVTEAEFRVQVASRALFDTLVVANSGMPQVAAIGVATTDGIVIASSRDFPARGTKVTDRDYFQTAIQPGFVGMMIGAPVLNRASGVRSLTLAQQITDIHGAPLGVVVLGLSLQYFEDFYRDINIGPGSAISLFRADGLLMARAPAHPELLGTSFADQPVFAQGINQGLRAGILDVADARLADAMAPSERVVAFRSLDRFPLVVNTTLTNEFTLAAWRRTSLAIIIGTLVMVGAMALLGVSLLRLIVNLRQSRRVLAEQRHTLDVTLNAMEQGIMLITPAHLVPVCNRRARELLDLPAEVSDVVHSFEQIRDLQYARGDFIDPRTGEQPPPRPLGVLDEAVQYERTRADGTVLRIQQTPLRDGGAVRTFTDVTGQRQTEAALRQSQRLDALGQLTAGIAHEFNNVLGVIISSLDLLAETEKLTPREVSALNDRARDAALAAAELVSSLLSFSRKQELRRESVDVARLITRSLPLLRQALAGALSVEIDISADLWPAMVDASHLDAAILNLILNARDASPVGSVLRIVAGNVTLRDTLETAHAQVVQPGDYVCLSVIDQGAGMDPQVLERVFEPFFTTKAFGKGSGLGLSMVYGTMDQLGGAITVDSDLGAGTTVRLFMPRAPGREAPGFAAAFHCDVIEGASRRRILVVEDNVRLRETASGILKVLGHEVVTAGDAGEAMAIWQTDPHFDLVFSDVVMPGEMNGVELVLTLLAQAPRLKVLLTSGFADPANANELIRDANLPMLHKPYRKAELAAKLNMLLAAE